MNFLKDILLENVNTLLNVSVRNKTSSIVIGKQNDKLANLTGRLKMEWKSRMTLEMTEKIVWQVLHFQAIVIFGLSFSGLQI